MLKVNPVINFFNKVNITQFCWEWIASKNDKGYGNFNVNGKHFKAHRFSYELFKGKIPKGLTIDHLCRNRGCVNPGHLEAVVHRENVLRGNGWAGINSRKIHCLRGHLLEGKNLFIYRGGRHCVECNLIRNQNYRNRIKLQVES